MASLTSGRLHVIGGGLAGSSLATLMAEDGIDVTLYDAGEPFESRWTRGMQTAPNSHKVAEPEIFYDPEELVSDFFSQFPEIPDKLVRPAHGVLALKRGRRKPAIVALNNGLAHALIKRRPGLVLQAVTAFGLWQKRFAGEDSRVDIPKGMGRANEADNDDENWKKGTYHRDGLAVLAEILFSMPAQKCSNALFGRILAPSIKALLSRNPAPVFSAIDPIILNDIALPALRERFLASGGRVIAHAPLGDIDSTSEYATDLLFGEDTQIVVKPQDAVVLALHPKQLCDAVPDIGFAPAPARRQTMVFEVRRQFAEPRGLFTSDDLVRAIYCNRRHIQVNLNSNAHLSPDATPEQRAQRIWQRCVWLCDQYLNIDLTARAENADGLGCPNFSFVDAEAPFPELTPGVAALRHRFKPPWKNLFLCGDSFPADFAPGPAALFESVNQLHDELHTFFGKPA